MAAVGTQPKVTLVSISNVNITNRFSMLSSRIKHAPTPAAPSASTSTSSTNTSEAQNKTFKRLRTSLEQSVRAATRSRAKSPPVVPVLDADELGNVKTVKGKEKAEEGSKLRKTRKSRRESFEPPSLRLASASTPTLTPSAPSTPTPVPPTPKRRPTPVNINTPPASPPPPETPTRPLTRRPSELRARSPSSPRRVTPVMGLRSTSATHLPLSPSPVPGAGRRSVDLPRRSIDSPGPSRAGSPTTPRRANTSMGVTRHLNSSTTSLSNLPPSPQREAIRAASSALCREMLKPGQLALGAREQEEVEVRMRPLARLERVWGKSGGLGMGSSSNLAVAPPSSAAGEERERRTFADALRDGYVLCQLMNKLRPGSIARVDAREDGRVRTSNVTKFLAAHASHGLPSTDRFMRDDLIEATADSLARVAKTISALINWAEAPAAPSVLLRGGKAAGGIYSGSISRAASSTPNLSSHGKSSPISKPRWPPPALPTVRADSPEGSTSSAADTEQARMSLELDDVPPILPPRSPLRARERVESAARASVMTTDSSAPSEGTAFSNLSLLEPSAGVKFGTMRTNTTADSSLPSEWPSLSKAEADSLAASLEDTLSLSTSSISPSIQQQQQPPLKPPPPLTPNRKRRPSETANVDLSRVLEEEGESTARARSPNGERAERIRLGKGKWPDDFMDLNSAPPPSQLAIPITPSKSSKSQTSQAMASSPPRSPPILIKRPSHDAVLSSSPPRASPPLSLSPLSLSPTRNSPRKVAVIGSSSSPTSELAPPSPRRPAHRARHSVDAPGLLPKGRDSSPNASASPTSAGPIMPINLRRDSSPGGAMLRRASTRHVSGGLLPKDRDAARRGSPDSRADRDRDSGSDITNGTERRSSGSGLSAAPPTTGAGPVPFPRTSNADVVPTPLSSDQRPRGRFQSEVDGASTRRKPRPNSFDEFASKGAGARRSRFESMVNLGGASSSATASDLMGPTAGAGLGLGVANGGVGAGAFGLGGEGGRRNSAGSAVAVRQPLVVREDNRPPTHFQLGNCIGRGQFGAVYRALNLNTGQMVAVKRISLEGLKEEEVRQLMKEVDLVKSLRHPSIVKYEGMARDKDTLSIVLEYAENGSLGQTLKAFGKLNERLVASYVVKILEGLDYLHQSHVVHCDLKAANILTTKNGNVKLADFGVSLNLRAMELSTQTGKDGKAHSRDVVGTPNWMAPEVIELKGARAKSDIWSLACTVVELLTGRPPYADIANSMTVMLRILEDERPPLPEGCSGPLKDFLELCFRKDPEMRPSAEELFEHEWLKKHWGLNKDLRPQDSIPFLRRVSADLHKNDAVRHLASLGEHDSDNGDGHRTPLSPTHKLSEPSTPTTHIGAHPHSYTPEFGPPEADLMSMREHTFVKTSFGKPVICRVCMQHIKKSAVLCSQCSLIAHSRCAAAAPPTCDLRSQLLLYAQFAEHNTTPNA
ncbi:hypothetical protein PENSPDRAFT_656389, partial [Peniophora sp. CONT]